MKPITLEMSGFMSYQEPTTIDFSDIDLFVLEGPTGSGKSSIIDAILFALYGQIPRHGGKTVGNIINTRKQEARVRFDFQLEGSEYTVVRQVKRGKRTVSTDEARLYRDNDLLTEKADEITVEVTKELGLDYKQFVSAVVLPQGEFAEFLTATPAKRQDVLVHLFGLGIYEAVLTQTQLFRAENEGILSATSKQLEDLRLPDDEEIKAAQQRIKQLKQLQIDLEKLVENIQQYAEQLKKLADATELSTKQLQVLSKIRLPRGLEKLADQEKELKGQLEQHKEEEKKVTAEGKQLKEKHKDLPELAELTRTENDLNQLNQAKTELDKFAAEQQDTEPKLAEQKKKTTELTKKIRAADEERTKAHQNIGAEALRTQLVVGEECPVCGQTVSDLPRHQESLDLTALEGSLEELKKKERDSRKRQTQLEEQLKRLQKDISTRKQTIQQLEEKYPQKPDLSSIQQQSNQRKKLDRQLKELRSQVDQSRSHQDQLNRELSEMQDRVDRAKRDLQAKREQLIKLSLEPPAVETQDFMTGWKTLTEWSQQAKPLIEKAQSDKAEQQRRLTEQIQQDEQSIVQLCQENGIRSRGKESKTELVIKEIGTTQQQLKQWDQDLKQSVELQKKVGRLEQQHKLAESLVNHLRANRFERWAIKGALDWLTQGANHRLGVMSEGRYELTKDKNNNFAVIDRLGQDQQRPVSSLSGGERFLVSLSLALSLSDYLAGSTVFQRRRLEMFILDEGFGTLDTETLETIIPVVMKLAQEEEGKKLVGLVTHVRQLAEQIPTRIMVSKDDKGGSTVEVEHR